MTDEEQRHTNVLLDDIKQQVKLVFEGHQVLRHEIGSTRQELKNDIAAVDQRVQRVEAEVKSLHGILAKLTELMEDHDKWLREHEVRIKAIESK